MAAERNVALSVVTRVVVCAVVLAFSAAIFWVLFDTKPEPSETDRGNALPRVVVMRADPVALQRPWTGYGSAEAMDSADVPARVTAVVVEVPPEIVAGRSVRAGQLLARLDESDFLRQVEISTETIKQLDAQLAQIEVEEQSWRQRMTLAEEDRRLARNDLERVQRALEAGAAKEREVDQANQTLMAAERVLIAAQEELSKVPTRKAALAGQRGRESALLKQAQENLERCRIVSPLDGVLAAVDVELGENVMAGQRIARVVNLDHVEVILRLPAGARRDVHIGDAVQLEATGPRPQSWSASVTRIAPVDDEATRTMTVFVELRQEGANEALLPPGKFVQGTVTCGQSQPRTVVPHRAVLNERLLVVEDGVLQSRDAVVDFQMQGELPQTGLPDRDWSVLRDPLPAGALVVVDAAGGLAPGMAVTVVSSGELAAAPGRRIAPIPAAAPRTSPQQGSTP